MSPPGDTRLPPAFDDLEVGVTLHDPETGGILDVNARLESFYGYSASELREMAVGEYTAAGYEYANRVARAKARAAAAGEEQVFEWRIERASGELVWVRVRLDRTTVDGWECVLAEIRDVTERKARERRLRLLNRVLRHNLRNETTMLAGYAQRLKEAVEGEPVEAEADTVLEVARDIGTIGESVRQLQEIAEPDATARSPVRVGDLVEGVVSEARDRFPKAAIALEVRADVWVNGDDGLRYALEHAVENAIEHNDAPVPRMRVVVSEDASGGRAVVEVVDDGPRIPEIELEALDHDTTRTSTLHGTGVGLWVMQWCVDSLGGDLSFDAAEPRGNVVRFELPTTTRRNVTRTRLE